MARGAFGFGIARSTDPVTSRARLAELCEVLTRDLGALFLPHHASSYRQLAADFGSGAAPVAWMPPLLCIELEKLQASSAIVLPVRNGSMMYYSALFARATGPRSLSEVRGARVAWVDPESSSGYLVPRLHLRAQGRSLAAMFAQEMLLGSHAEVLNAVESGRADVGATHCASKAPQWLTARGESRALGALTIAGPIPNDAVVVSPSLPEGLRRALVHWLVSLEAARSATLTAELLGAAQFRSASFGHFTPLRRMLGAASYA
jgi:phosphonate transport system substrate-binding protein